MYEVVTHKDWPRLLGVVICKASNKTKIDSGFETTDDVVHVRWVIAPDEDYPYHVCTEHRSQLIELSPSYPRQS